MLVASVLRGSYWSYTSYRVLCAAPGMANANGSVAEGLSDVGGHQVGVRLEDLLISDSVAEHADHSSHRDAEPSNAPATMIALRSGEVKARAVGAR